MNGLFNPDMSDALTTQDARTKLNVALDRNDTDAMAQWARDYGAAALEFCGREHDGDEIEKLEEEIEDLKSDLADADAEKDKLKKEKEDLQAKLTEALQHA